MNNKPTLHRIGVRNEWGRLNEVMTGIVDEIVEPDYVPALRWMKEEDIAMCRKSAGQETRKFSPAIYEELKYQVDNFAKVLKKEGVVVHRNIPLRYKEEDQYLSSVQRGKLYHGGADFFRVIDNNLILINNLRYPFRRKQVWSIRPVLEKIIRGRDIRYVAVPPVSPHYSDDDMYLENGDILQDGQNIYVGFSGNGSSHSGREWLTQYLGPQYHVFPVKIDPGILHLDTVLMLNRPGLLTYYPDFVKELPGPLAAWDKIEVYSEPEDEVHFGANSISLSEDKIIISEEYARLEDEYKKHGMDVIRVPMRMSMRYGAGPRCLTAVLSRDP